jgi:hypothetical protein
MAFDYNGNWKNQLEATMSLTVAADGVVNGTYQSPAAQAKAPLVGFVRHDFLIFSVAMDTSVGTMLCQPSADPAADTVDSWWHFRLFDDRAPEWACVRTGCDVFSRTT